MTVANDSPSANDPSDVKAAESGWVYDPFPGPGLDVWRYGTERPCYLEGQYITFEADYSQINLDHQRDYPKSICMLGVMGNFIVDEEPVVTVE